MCGITGAFHATSYKPKDNPANVAVSLYGTQKSRGSDGFGALTILPNQTTKLFRATEATSIVLDLKLHKLLQGHEPIGVLFHHRYPTSTDNTLKTTHPFLISHKSLKRDYYVVHNGVISNDDELKPKHEALGYVYQSVEHGKWNDSEACAIEFCRAIENRKHKIGTLGSQAIVAVSVDKTTKKALNVYLTTNGGNPISYNHSQNTLTFASAMSGVKVKDSELVIYNIGSNKIRSETIQFVKPKPVAVPKYSYTPPATIGYDTTKAHKPYQPVYSSDFYDRMGLVAKPIASPDVYPYQSEVEEIQKQVDEYIDVVCDPSTAIYADPKPYVDSIERYLNTIRDKELKAQMTDALVTA